MEQARMNKKYNRASKIEKQLCKAAFEYDFKK
jgi:hypothetical protein